MKPFTYNVRGARKGVRILNARAQTLGVMYTKATAWCGTTLTPSGGTVLPPEQGHVGLS